MSDHLGKISETILEFFKEKRVSESIAKFHEMKVTGWEKWWQMEFAVFLDSYSKITEWDMEHKFQTDKRSSLGQDSMALDIGFKFKGGKKDEWYFVELKQALSYKECISRMMLDANKVFSARKKSSDGLLISYIACAGIFLNEEEDVILDYAEVCAKKDDIPCDDGFFIEKIDKHHTLLVL